MEVVEKIKSIIVDRNPDLILFREILSSHPELIEYIDYSTCGSLLHYCAKWDTFFQRKGLLTYVMLYEFNADPNIHYEGSLALYWAANQIHPKGPDYEAAKFIIQHRDFEIFTHRGKRGSAIIVMCIKFKEHKYLINYMMDIDTLRKLEKDRARLKKRLLALYSSKDYRLI